MGLPSKANVAAGLREFLAILPVFYILTLMWWCPGADKYLPGVVAGALLLYSLCGKWPVRERAMQRKQTLYLLARW